MKDYDEYLKEEARQDQLQESLESKRDAQTCYTEFDGDWKMYLEEHRHDTKDDSNQYYDDCDYELLEAMALADFSEDPYDDCYYPECEDDWDYDDMELAYDPYGDLLAEDLYDTYANACEEFFGSDPDVEDDLDDLIASENIKFEVNPEKLRISRKAVSRNRHHASERAKKKAKKSAEILEAKFWKLCTDLTSYKEANYWRLNPETTKKDAFVENEYLRPNEMRRLYHAEKAATKKANRVKTETA